jgi:hypothetical protein
MQNKNKIAGWALCLVSIILLASMGKLDLLVVLLPASAVLTLFLTGINGRKSNAAEPRKKGLA